MADAHHPPDGPGAGGSAKYSIDSPQFQVAARNPRRTEGVAAVGFIVGLVGFVAFGAAFWQNANNYLLGATLGVGLTGLGFAFVVWGKYLMPRGPFEEPRAQMKVTEEQREELIGDFVSRGRVAVERRSILVKLMGLAAGVFGVVALFPLIRSLGPLPKKQLYGTTWQKGSFLTTIDGKRVKVDDIPVGGLVTVFPPNDLGGAYSQTVLIHVQAPDDPPIVTEPGRETWSPAGYLAYSKVCTHAGCPVGLYEKQRRQLLCPCHQSLFDVMKGALPVFGPAPRPLAQLPLYVDRSGYLRAQKGYDEPVGPGFWERGGTT